MEQSPVAEPMVELESALGRLRVLQNEAGNNNSGEPAPGQLLYEILNDVVISVTKLRDQVVALEVILKSRR